MNNLKSPISNQSAIELHIEELVLHDFAPGDRYSVADAVEQELTRLLTEQAISPAVRDAETSLIDAGSFKVAPGSKAAQIGARVGQSIYQGLRTDASLTAGPGRSE